MLLYGLRRDYKVKPLVDIHPNWNSVLRAKREVVKEVKAWDEFAKKEDDESEDTTEG